MSDEGGLGDVKTYYDREYDSLLDSSESDDLYDLDANLQPIYRSQVQLENMARLANLPKKGRILDFGCGKGGFLARFHTQYPEWELWGIDLSERYRSFLEPMVGRGHFKVGGLTDPLPFEEKFDLITIFFVAEHLAEPQITLSRVVDKLSPNGYLYLTVPNILSNSIDAFLADHVSHFSALSLSLLLQRVGLRPILISEHHQLGNITLMAVREPSFLKQLVKQFRSDAVDAFAGKIRTSIDYWTSCVSRLKEFLAARDSRRGMLAVYGAGVFGSYLAMNSGSDFEAIRCFMDQNPFKVGKEHMGKPIVHPSKVPKEVSEVLVGLNPGRAKEILTQAGLLTREPLQFFFP